MLRMSPRWLAPACDVVMQDGTPSCLEPCDQECSEGSTCLIQVRRCTPRAKGPAVLAVLSVLAALASRLLTTSTNRVVCRARYPSSLQHPCGAQRAPHPSRARAHVGLPTAGLAPFLKVHKPPPPSQLQQAQRPQRAHLRLSCSLACLMCLLMQNDAPACFPDAWPPPVIGDPCDNVTCEDGSTCISIAPMVVFPGGGGPVSGPAGARRLAVFASLPHARTHVGARL